jgi:hypothetical protein
MRYVNKFHGMGRIPQIPTVRPSKNVGAGTRRTPISRRTALRLGITSTFAVGLAQPVAAPIDGKGNDPLVALDVDDTATLNPTGRMVVVTGGGLACDNDKDIVELNVNIEQASTGASAEGTFRGRCTGVVDDYQQWEIRMATKGGPSFEETDQNKKDSYAQADAWARTRNRGRSNNDRVEWSNPEVTLIKL